MSVASPCCWRPDLVAFAEIVTLNMGVVVMEVAVWRLSLA